MPTRAGLDQRRVIQAAVELADANGLHEVTLAALATRLGVRAPTLYHYVDGLTGLRRELAIQGCQELAHRLGEAIMGKAGDDAVLALADAYRAFAAEHPGLYAATVQAADPADTVLNNAQTAVVAVAMRALSAYHLTHEDAVHVIRMLRSVVHGFVTLEHAGGFGMPVDLDRSYNGLLRLLLVGLKQQSRPSV
ncbi:MAG: TetR/AcrR family transcriptional regulator [Anaerolineae bacterium]|nr:TetR/AcrR family transcriptional regulator [Anaerolineae bacterium]